MITTLFVRSDSVYKDLGIDCYDISRDARSFNGSNVVIAHPPCRAWGRLKHFANPRQDEKELAIFAVEKVRKNGGVLEHPCNSSLWAAANLPLPSAKTLDGWGGFTLDIDQFWFGHKAKKRTWLYIVGVLPSEIPNFSLNLNCIQYHIGGGKSQGKRGLKSLHKALREHTPKEMALWLIELCNRIEDKKARAAA